VVSSGDLLAPHFAAHGLRDARCVVLGTPDSITYVADAGGRVWRPAADRDLDALVVCDESGFPFLETVDVVLSALYRALDAGRDVALVLANPDLIYPKQPGEFGLAAGSIAVVLEAALALRYPRVAPRFVRLGKPHAPLFDEACRRAGTRDAVMIGDQLATDIAGANAFGIASALIGTGLTPLDQATRGDVLPTYVVRSLARAPAA
jgi:ribonucleotide monophosphatase NagD (HAD superfamily)